MIRWNSAINREEENPQVDLFLQEIAEVCKKHGFSLSHEDGQGSFIVQEYSEDNIEWLMGASIEIAPRGTNKPPLTGLDALTQEVEWWEVLAETGADFDRMIEKFPDRFSFLSSYRSNSPCCEYTCQQAGIPGDPGTKECHEYCPAGAELGYCIEGSSFNTWINAHDYRGRPETPENLKRIKELALEVLKAFKAAKIRLKKENHHD